MNYLKNILEIFIISTRLGLTSFGGPSAHLGYFHAEYVDRKKWIDEKSYADLVALAQFLPGPASSQVGVIVIAAIVGLFLFKNDDTTHVKTSFPINKYFSIFCLILFFALLIMLPILREITGNYWITFIDSFYRSGSLVFGGGHVVLPLLEQEFVALNWISEEAFLAGYAATQAVPGPLFTFAAYLGTVMNGWFGGIIATLAIFLPAFLLILGCLPFWDMIRNHDKAKRAIMGVNAAVVGILFAALYTPIATSAIHEPKDFALAAILFVMLNYLKLAPWIIVLSGAVGGILISFI